MNTEKEHVIYGLFDPTTKELRYVGYTSDQDKRYSAHCRNKSGTKEKRVWISQLKKQGLKPVMEVIEEYQTAKELPEAEEFWYGYFKLVGAELYNDPYRIGEGIIKGWHHTEEAKQKISENQMGRTSAMKGKHHTEETKLKISETNRGRTVSEEHRNKISAGNSGKIRTEETKQKLSAINRTFSDEVELLIFQEYKSATMQSLADKYGVGIATIFNIIERQKPLGFDMESEILKDIRNKITILNSEKTSVEENKRGKLSDNDVRVIKKLLLEGISNSNIAKIYNVNPSTISNIKRAKKWKHIS